MTVGSATALASGANLHAEIARRLGAVADQRGGRLRLPEPRPGAAPPLVGRIADDEPLLRSDEAAARRAPALLLRGLGALSLLAGSRRVVLAIRADYRELLGTFRRLTSGSSVDVVALPPRYPLDDRSLLADLSLLLALRPASLLGTAVFGASSLVAVGEALAGQPLLERPVSIVGAVTRPQTRFLPLGCSVEAAVELCGGATTRAWVAYENGIVAGRRVLPEDVVDLATRGLVILPADHPRVQAETVPLVDHVRRAASVCQQCRLCSEGCPVWLAGAELQPHRLLQLLGHGFHVAAATASAHDPQALAALQCIGCRACSVRCPASLDPARLVADLGQRLRSAGVELVAPPALAPRPQQGLRRLTIERLEQQLRPLPPTPPVWVPEAALVARLALPLRDPEGRPRLALAGPGDEVRRGALLLRAGHPGAVDVFAPRAGIVEGIDPDRGLLLSCG